ncbi:MAG: hypothetical protein F4226_08585 [Synechococcus sp. SB0678_bin_12]|nr:hypothetical protein [Synechococcus sp. SB0678_bin_12]
MPASVPAPAPTTAPTAGPVLVAVPWWQQWVTPAVLLVAAGLFLTQQNRGFDALNTQIDVLREDLQASEARWQKALGRLEGKVDRLFESR